MRGLNRNGWEISVAGEQDAASDGGKLDVLMWWRLSRMLLEFVDVFGLKLGGVWRASRLGPHKLLKSLA